MIHRSTLKGKVQKARRHAIAQRAGATPALPSSMAYVEARLAAIRAQNAANARSHH